MPEHYELQCCDVTRGCTGERLAWQMCRTRRTRAAGPGLGSVLEIDGLAPSSVYLCRVRAVGSQETSELVEIELRTPGVNSIWMDDVEGDVEDWSAEGLCGWRP